MIINKIDNMKCSKDCEFNNLETCGHGDVSYVCRLGVDYRGYAPLGSECPISNETKEKLLKEINGFK